MFNKVLESSFIIQPFLEKMETYYVHIFLPNSQNLEFFKSLAKNFELLII